MKRKSTCVVCGTIWHPKDFKQQQDRITCSRACSSVVRSIAIKRVWQRPQYRSAVSAKLRAASALGRAALAANPRVSKLPPRKTPEGRYYRKLRHAVGAKAAREALGIGQ